MISHPATFVRDSGVAGPKWYRVVRSLEFSCLFQLNALLALFSPVPERKMGDSEQRVECRRKSIDVVADEVGEFRLQMDPHLSEIRLRQPLAPADGDRREWKSPSRRYLGPPPLTPILLFKYEIQYVDEA